VEIFECAHPVQKCHVFRGNLDIRWPAIEGIETCDEKSTLYCPQTLRVRVLLVNLESQRKD